MTRIVSNLAVFAGVMLSAALPGKSMAATLTTAYLNEPMLALTQTQLNADAFPHSIFVAGMPLTFSSDIKLACRSVNTTADHVLVYLPRTKACLNLITVFKQAQNTQPHKAHFATLQRDRIALAGELQNESYVVLKPASGLVKPNLMLAGIAAEMCICPPPEEIFINGFESTL